MHCRLVVVLLLSGCAWAQTAQPSDVERVISVLRKNDPLRNGEGAVELLGPGASLEAAIRATARSVTAERVVRLRAQRLVRVLELTHRLGDEQTRRSVAWWLALDEIDRELPAAVRPLLLSRSGIADPALSEALRELAIARDSARRFCLEWNETRTLPPTDEAEREQNRKYDEFETALARVDFAAVPALLEILTVPPDVAFARLHPEDGVSARQQVRAILALSAILHVQAALPYFVMHANGPSLTQSSDASMAIQELTGEQFGAAMLVDADEAALLKWWEVHRAEHDLVLDHLVHHVVMWAEADLGGGDAHRTEGARCSLMRLRRVLGKTAGSPADASAEVLHAQLEAMESEWLQRLRPR